MEMFKTELELTKEEFSILLLVTQGMIKNKDGSREFGIHWNKEAWNTFGDIADKFDKAYSTSK